MADDYILEIPENGSSPTQNTSAVASRLTNAQKTKVMDGTPRQDTSTFYDEKGIGKVGLQSSQRESERRLSSVEGSTNRKETEATKSVRWYFKENTETSSPGEFAIDCVSECCPPVKADASERFTRLTRNSHDTKDIKCGIHNVFLAISIQNLNLKSIESIAFSAGPGPGRPYYYGPLEVFTKQELKTIFSESTGGVALLKLHRQYEERDDYMKSFVLDMEIRTTSIAAANADPGFVELHFIELQDFQSSHSICNTPLNLHEQFLWSIDVSLETALEAKPLRTRQPSRIIHYATSGDGNYISTLSAKDTYLQLDLWDLEQQPRAAVPVNGVDSTTHDTDVFNERRSPFYPQLRAQSQMSMSQPVLSTMGNVPLTVSVSWDGSKVALIAGSRRDLKNTFRLLAHESLDALQKKKTASTASVPFSDITHKQLCVQLENFCGFGKFHMVSLQNRNLEDELFITCDGKTVGIYGVHGRWVHLRTIQLSITDDIPEPRRLVEGLRAHYFSWSDKNSVVSICDLETGKLVCSTTAEDTTAIFSDDGSMMVFREAGDILTSRWSATGTILSSTDVSNAHPSFIYNGARIIMPVAALDEAYGRGKFGMILDATNLSVVERVSVPVRRYEPQQLSTGAHGQYLYSMHGSKLDLIRLKDAAVSPYPQPRYRCDDICFNELRKLRAPDVFSAHDNKGTFTENSGLEFRVDFCTIEPKRRRKESALQSVVVWVSGIEGQEREALRIPPAEIGSITDDCLQYQVYFEAAARRMVVYTKLYVMVWSLPETVDKDFTLLSTWWTQTVPFQVTDKNDWCWTELSMCSHGQTYLKICNVDENFEDEVLDVVRLRCDDVFGSQPYWFLDGVLILVEMFDTSDDGLRQAILHYIGRYINSLADPNFCSDSILSKICHSVTQQNHVLYAKFLKALLDSPHGRWVPKPNLDCEANPVWMLLNLTKAIPRAIDLAQIVIDYLIRMATKEKDPHFLIPIMRPLHELISQQELYTDAAHGTLRKMAYIPVKERTYIIDHAVIAHPPDLLGRLWRPRKQHLYECKNPVLRVDREPEFRPHNTKEDNFTNDLFFASFDMLWRAPEEKADTRRSIEKISSTAKAPQSWIRTLFHVVLLKCKPKSHVGVECHEFSLELFDNPAIAALVEYKWNTIGYPYWLLRFVWQCIYYLLVLVAVFMQVYSNEQSSLLGVFIAIIVLAVVFLWLEIVQAVHRPGQYFSSLYNVIDVIVFALPLSASACQVVNIVNGDSTGNIATLSFSVLFIFLHFLFELRVNRSVCHFVTIIIRIIGEIQVFFIVFAAGILAFTIAILHLLRGCPVGTCDSVADVVFPSHFFAAFSSTYFFMGGIWDPVSDNFTSSNWAFHIMMITYFFFTSILLLNVLIALINVAFTAGDETWVLVWTENRLRYVEAAENMTYNIPGFRDAHDWFPEEIYYSATLQEIKNYRAKYFKKNGEDAGRNDTTQKLFGQGSSAKKILATNASYASSSSSTSSSLTQLASASEDTLLDQQQQIITDLKKDMLEVQEKTDKRVEDIQAQLAEMKQMLLSFCKES